jgi:hypothetical protein
LVWLAEGKEESEWGRLSVFMAFVGNLLRFSDSAPSFTPRDFNPFVKHNRQPKQSKSIKEKMGEFWANNPQIPVEHWKQIDGQWVKVDPPKEGE